MSNTDTHAYDLLVHAGRVVCPATGLDGPGAVAVRGDRIVAVNDQIDGTAQETLDFPDAMLLPGLVDMHAHPAREGSKYGVDPDVHFLSRGVTTVLSQGDAGAGNCVPISRIYHRRCTDTRPTGYQSLCYGGIDPDEWLFREFR